MQIKVDLERGCLPDRFTKHAAAADLVGGVPGRSFPFAVSDLPAGTKTLALTLVDYDSIPVCGFAWIHWLAANLPASWTQVPENASRTPELAAKFVQGKNSNANRFAPREPVTQVGYTGPQPPDKRHDYTLTAYALDAALPLEDGYWANDFRRARQGHVLATAQLALPCEA